MPEDTENTVTAAAVTTVNVTDGTLKGKVTGPTFTGNVDGAKFTGSVTYTNTTPPPSTNKLDDAIKQNTPGNSEAYAMGTPNHQYGWYAGKSTQNVAPPANFTSMAAWGVFFPEDGQPVVAGNMQVLNMEGWVLLKSGVWSRVQDQASMDVDGGYYYADFHEDIHTPWTTTKLSDGSRQGPTPPGGQTVHWWPRLRGVYTAGQVAGSFVKVDVKINGPANMRFVAQTGGDWWLSKDAPFVPGFANNPCMGSSNWLKMTTSWRTLYYYSITTDQIKANPPPPLK